MNELGPYQRNQIYAGECADMMSRLPDGCIDLTVTSPPYDNLRDYNGYTLDWQAVIKQLYRVTKPGGVVVWVVADATINGSETGTSFRQALWAMECGFNLHDTMIYHTSKQPMNDNRYQTCFEYMFVFSYGSPMTFNPIKVRSKYAGEKVNSTFYNTDGSKKNRWHTERVSEYKTKENIWYFVERPANGHPAIFPEALARDHIISWSNPGDLVLDPFMGSGTTAKMAMQNGRDYLGFDISPEYVELAKKRVAWANPPLLVVS